MKKILCHLAMLVICITACAQDVKKDITAINKAYEKADRLSMSLEYAVYLDGSRTPYEKEIGLYRKNGSSLYMKQMGTEIMSNEKYVTIVNHDSKLVMMDKARKVESLPWESSLDTLLSMYQSVKFFVPEGTQNIKAYSFRFAGGKYEKVDLWFNSSTYMAEKIQAHYRNKIENDDGPHKVMLELNFRNIDTGSKPPAGIFSPGAYVMQEKGKYVLKPAYRNYRLINHLIAGK
jgi:outer membrane lipoprotein-sorting protein